MQWLIARYQPTSLFSLKHGDATSTGGKSLLIPTPFAIRTALLDVAIRTEGVAAGPQAFERIKSLRLALRPPSHAAVASIFVKILKPEREAEARGREMAQTIAFREYVHLTGELALAFGGQEEALMAIRAWLGQVNYFGKRGGFYQLLAQPNLIEGETEQPPKDMVELSGPNLMQRAQQGVFPLGMLQRVDDWGEPLTLAKANIYNRENKDRIRLGEERVRMDVFLPYRLVSSSRGYTLYERFDP